MADNASNQPRLLLHSYFRSSCSARVRTAAHLKNIPLEYSYIHLLKGDQSSSEYTSTNPSASVPTLTVTSASHEPIVIRQSIAILEFLEEYFPEKRKLLPDTQEAVARARVRDLVNIIATDMQPPTNLRILKKVKKITQGDNEAPGEWAKDLMTRGLLAYDKVAEKYAGKYSVGDEITLADVCLAPAVEGALRYNVDIKQFPIVDRVYTAIKGLEEFKRGDWKHQPDTPEEFRASE